MGKTSVTGAAGNIGSPLVENLRGKNLEVISEVNSQVRLLPGKAANSFSRFAEDQAGFWK
jgi:nucleoside-diphosphate-sugar epimerase